MAYITLSLIICLIGLLAYFFGEQINPKVSEAGRLAFAVGLLALLLK